MCLMTPLVILQNNKKKYRNEQDQRKDFTNSDNVHIIEHMNT